MMTLYFTIGILFHSAWEYYSTIVNHGKALVYNITEDTILQGRQSSKVQNSVDAIHDGILQSGILAAQHANSEYIYL